MGRGCSDSRARLKDMDSAQVDIQVPFPTLPGLAGLTFIEIGAKDYALALIRAYNDWLVEGWAAADPERILPAAILPLWDPPAAADELRRVVGNGIKVTTLPSAPQTIPGVKPYPDESGEPVWDALEETGVAAE